MSENYEKQQNSPAEPEKKPPHGKGHYHGPNKKSSGQSAQPHSFRPNTNRRPENADGVKNQPAEHQKNEQSKSGNRPRRKKPAQKPLTPIETTAQLEKEPEKPIAREAVKLVQHNKPPKNKKPAQKPRQQKEKEAQEQPPRRRGRSQTLQTEPQELPPMMSFHPENSRRDIHVRHNSSARVKIISLGGLGEIGKNITLFECGNDIIIVDCGSAFPDDDMLGIDLVVPDITYLENNRDKIRGIFITHGHEDHIGSIPYFLKKINVPLYGTRLSLGILENKLQEHGILKQTEMHVVTAGSCVQAGCFGVEFIHVNHSIPDACAFAIHTPAGVIVHTGDFKIDTTPISGDMINLTRFGELGREGVLALLCESTNVERPGYSPSERKVGASLDGIFRANPSSRIIIATFSSNVHRVQQILDAAARYGRKCAVSGRSMLNVIGAAIRLGYITVPEGLLIDINEVSRYPHEEICIVTTGSQGEPMSALYRMAFADHSQIAIGPKDVIVISASPIPGNEKYVGKVINELFRHGGKVVYDAIAEVHVSGHACQEEIKTIHALTKPKYFIPIHGEYRMLLRHANLAMSMGMSEENIFILDVGQVLEIGENSAEVTGTVPNGIVLIDGLGVGDVGNIVLRDRKHLSEDGLIVVAAAINTTLGTVAGGPDVVSRGFVYVRESEEMMAQLRAEAVEVLEECLADNQRDWSMIKNRIKDALGKTIFAKTKRRPMILPVLTEIK